VYIRRAALEIHPHGTGWEGLLLLGWTCLNVCPYRCIFRSSSSKNSAWFYSIRIWLVYSPCSGVSPSSKTRWCWRYSIAWTGFRPKHLQTYNMYKVSKQLSFS
jgi:hypothetical protein